MNEMTALERGLIADYMKEYENYRFGKTGKAQYQTQNMRRAEKLWELNPEQPIYHLMCAAMLICAGKTEEGERILKKYEHNHGLQFRNPQFRAYFLYLAAQLSSDKQQRGNIVIQLNKLYQKDPMQPSLYWFLVQTDEGFVKNPEKRLAFLEKQWRFGCRQNLLYIEVIQTLRGQPALAENIDNFLMQSYIWAQRRHLITKEMACQIARTAMRLKSCDKRYEYLLRETFRMFATKELLAALCSLYIRAGRTDRTAAKYYAKGVESGLKLTNLYEYYMMATVEQKKKILPEQVLFHFLYHDTLSAPQKAYLYKNLVSYRMSKPEIYEKYQEKIEKYTVESLLQRKISPEYAYLYEHVLCPQIFTKEMAEAMTELMFLRRLICTDVRIREAEISYEQLNGKRRIPLKKQQAYVPVYSPAAVITLIDDAGNQYRNTVSYKLEKLFDEKKYIDVCKEHVTGDKGLLIYLCGKNPENMEITAQTEPFFRQIIDTRGFADSYRNAVLVHLLEYAQSAQTFLELPESWFLTDNEAMTKEQRGRMAEFLIRRKMYADAFERLERYGAAFVSAHALLKLLTALADCPEAETETYYRLCYGCFKNSQMNFTTLKYLSESFLGTCAQMAALWKQAKAFGVDTYSLEERILVQMMFTGTALSGNFDIYLSYNERTPDETVKKAYLTYMSREAFVKNKELDGRFYFLLEDELFKNQGYAKVCIFAYLKYLSGQQTLSSRQKKMMSAYLKEFLAAKRCFGFMQKFGNVIPEALVLEDKVFAEYYAPAASSVLLHSTVETSGGEKLNYTVSRIYPLCGGIYSRAFTLFEGEKLTYFFTERREDGTECSTQPVTVEKTSCIRESGTRYARINEMCRLLEKGDKAGAVSKAEHYGFLETAAEELFPIK